MERTVVGTQQMEMAGTEIEVEMAGATQTQMVVVELARQDFLEQSMHGGQNIYIYIYTRFLL